MNSLFPKYVSPLTHVALSLGKVDAKWRTDERIRGSGPGDKADWRQLKWASYYYCSHVTIHHQSCGPDLSEPLAGMTIYYQPRLSCSLVTFAGVRTDTAQETRHAFPTPSMCLSSDLEGPPLGLTKLHQIEMRKSCFSMIQFQGGVCLKMVEELERQAGMYKGRWR
ncbi:Poly(rC)-binding protein 2 [Pteropus alecto]|uniref:Poly(RC)-binding protein 2 n=1 Tax=Pteropus alecto TaxID=9402 RepID=L5KY33_PTEAL|nr:Poly(rC)-binding protein 2 [Pteropus alecto]